ncbi:MULTISPECIES: hypothetical protein [unclassified Micromonospora]|uniref:hypothetical protein n=1 Tax=unclassified Micromonospora TaxID=2617518 RepID=UPI003327F5B2
MDPISIAVTILAIYGMLQRSPQWAGELAEEWRAAKRGEESPAAAARRQRLIDAGVDPATGGPLRQYVGNRWRDFWLDEDIKATRRRAARLDKEAAGEALSWQERLASRMDDEVTRRAEQWRTRPPADVVPPVTTTGGTTPDTGGSGDTGTTPPSEPHTAGPDSGERWTSSTVHDDDFYVAGGARGTHDGMHSGWTRDAPTAPSNATPRDPIRVDATVGDLIRPTRNQPTAAPAAITAGGTMSNAIAQQAVTGVVSGAAEARAIQAAMNQATEEYIAKLNRLRSRIYSLGEQTLGTVQMSGRSQVVANTAAAAEAAAAATANAKACTAEVEPLLGNVARAFDRINS